MRYKRLRKEENCYNANVVEKQCFSGESDVSWCFWGGVWSLVRIQSPRLMKRLGNLMIAEPFPFVGG